LQQIKSFRETEAQNAQVAKETQQRRAQVMAIGKETTNFLADYTEEMRGLSQSAEALTGENLQNTMRDNGEVTEGSISRTANAMQQMVDDYNRTMQTLDENVGHGPAVRERMDAMAEQGESDERLAEIGINQGEDGTLSFNADTFTQAMQSAAADDGSGQMQRMESTISNLAEGVRGEANDALREPAGRLVSYDLADISRRNGQEDSPERNFEMYARNGTSVNFANQMAVGLLMNFAA
jgi:hypothetical protein